MTTIEYFYTSHSAYAYLGAKRLMEICQANGCVLRHRPMALGPVVAAVGGLDFRGRSNAHIDYFFGREIDRWAEWRNVKMLNYRPTHHDKPLELPNGMLIAAIEQGADVDALSYAILAAHWQQDADISDIAILRQIGKTIGLDPNPLLDAALSKDVQAILQANTAEAIARSVFGAPTYFVDGDMFYGQDRLELLEHALSNPFKIRR